MKIPRILITAGASGSGKTLITCGIEQAMLERKKRIVSFKCGPDYIDPMFHTTVLGTPSRNIDPFFTDAKTTRYLFCKNARDAQLAVIEGVMGYYDGLGGVSTEASAYDVAEITKTPAVLVVNCKGMSLSVLAHIKGFMEYRSESRIRGVILNRLSPMLYPAISQRIREELGLTVLGYVPQVDALSLESRHLGLVMPDEIAGIREKLHELAVTLEKTLDLDALLELAEEAEDLDAKAPACLQQMTGHAKGRETVTVAVAKDEAFCFLYRDNLDLLEECGVSLRYFSPIHDTVLPKVDGLLLCGGYPELHVKKLSGNESMRRQILEKLRGGMPCMAECGGFMYLQREMEDEEGNIWPVVGYLPGKAFRTKKLGRFGYITLETEREGVLGSGIGPLKAHEFHYYDTTDNGACFHAEKPLRSRGWDCIHADERMLAGFPHLYYYSAPGLAMQFADACLKYQMAEGVDKL